MAPNADGDVLTARLTLHSGSDTTARDEAGGRVESALDGGGIAEWRIESVEIVEPPAAPFEPHTLEVTVVAAGGAHGTVADALEAEGLSVRE